LNQLDRRSFGKLAALGAASLVAAPTAAHLRRLRAERLETNLELTSTGHLDNHVQVNKILNELANLLRGI
jgi:hypothetical protein